MAEATAHTFRIGVVLKSSISILIQNIVPFGLLTVVMMAPFGACVFAFLAFRREDSQYAPSSVDMYLLLAFAVLGSLLLSYNLVTATLIHGSVQALRGQPATFGNCIGRGFARIPGVLGVVAVTWTAILAVALTSLVVFAVLDDLLTGALWYFLVMALAVSVPIMILICMFWLAVPVAVVERPGVFASIRRSIQLTRGQRWRIFIVILIPWVVYVISQRLFGMLQAMVEEGERGGIPVAITVVAIAVDLILIAVSAVAAAVGYYTIRAAKEGVSIEEIAKVFD